MYPYIHILCFMYIYLLYMYSIYTWVFVHVFLFDSIFGTMAIPRICDHNLATTEA